MGEPAATAQTPPPPAVPRPPPTEQPQRPRPQTARPAPAPSPPYVGGLFADTEPCPLQPADPHSSPQRCAWASYDSDPPSPPRRPSYGAGLTDGVREQRSSRSRRPQHAGAHARPLPRVAVVERLPHLCQHQSPPPAAEGATLVAHQGQLLLCGGTDGGRVSDGALWAYDLRRRRWQVIAPAAHPLQRHGHAAAVCDGHLYIHGGVGTPPGESPCGPGLLSSLFRKDLNTVAAGVAGGDWAEVPPPRWQGDELEPVAYHSCVSSRSRHRLFFFGGAVSGGRTARVMAFDTAAGRWLPPAHLNEQLYSGGGVDTPCPRSGHCATLWAPPQAALVSQGGAHRAAPEHMIVFGGSVGRRCHAADAYSYDLDSCRWSRLYCGGQLPGPRAGHSGVAFRESLIIYGGHDHGEAHDTTDSASAGGQSPVAGSPTARSGRRYLSDCFTLNLVTLTWRRIALGGPLGPAVGVRSGHCAALFEDGDRSVRMLLWGGKGELPPDTDWVDGGDADGQPDGSHVGTAPRVVCLDDAWLVMVAPPPPARSVRRPLSARTRPQSARTRSSPPRDCRPRGAALSATWAPPRKPGPGEHPPWIVQTSKATTAREFGEAERPPQLGPGALGLLLAPCELDTVVARLANTSRQAERRAALEQKYLSRSEPERRQMTREEQEDFVERIYFQQMEVRAHFRKQLQKKYCPRRRYHRMRPNDIQESVVRLHKAPEPPEEGLPPCRVVRRTEHALDKAVDRLYSQGMRSQQELRQALAQKYTFERGGKRYSPQEVGSIVTRLYGDSGRPRDRH
eukprot:TRINITY_DN24587_c0_g2_i1.p1 TRINITY_DN24587_c0_g2~~TRINITY_DN24587_c0_g2_i1.p1  ORF type:complete len:818 (+),score=191.06 TRINITY_DN24587_c0_g2_i1:84-2456(+)